jgi:nucleoside-diphosphate-sugar epimerase
MIAVVTGASGFIGSHLVDALLAAGATVRVIVRPATVRTRVPGGVERVPLDLLRADGLAHADVWNGATHVFHVAGRIAARMDAQFAEGNVLPTTRLADALALRTSPPHLVLVSSLAAVGPAPSLDRPVREADTATPVEAYGRSKYAAECAVLAQQDRMPVTIIRPAAVYGPRDRGFLSMFRQLRQPLAFYAVPPYHALSLVHVDDVVAALLQAATAPEAVGATYHVAHPDALTWRDLYARTARAMHRTPGPTVPVPQPLMRLAALAGDAWGAISGQVPLINRHKLALARPPWWVCDATRITHELGWSARVAHDEGLRATYAWYQRAGWIR